MRITKNKSYGRYDYPAAFNWYLAIIFGPGQWLGFFDNTTADFLEVLPYWVVVAGAFYIIGIFHIAFGDLRWPQRMDLKEAGAYALIGAWFVPASIVALPFFVVSIGLRFYNASGRLFESPTARAARLQQAETEREKTEKAWKQEQARLEQDRKAQELSRKRGLWKEYYKVHSFTDACQMTGLEFEHFLCRLFHAMGNRAELTGHSPDHGVDILVNYEGQKYAVQAKRWQKPVGNKAMQEVYAGMAYYNCDKAMVITTATFTSAAIDMANRLSIKLINGPALANLCERWLPTKIPRFDLKKFKQIEPDIRQVVRYKKRPTSKKANKRRSSYHRY